jgi:hypothetical protein
VMRIRNPDPKSTILGNATGADLELKGVNSKKIKKKINGGTQFHYV